MKILRVTMNNKLIEKEVLVITPVLSDNIR